MATGATRQEKRERKATTNWHAHMVGQHGMYRAEEQDARGAYRRKATEEELRLSTAEAIGHGYASHEIVMFTEAPSGAPMPRRATLSEEGTPTMRDWHVEMMTRAGPTQPREEEGGMAEQDGDARDWCYVREAAMALKIEYDAMYRRVSSGQIRARGLGRTREIPIKDFLARLPNGGYTAEEIGEVAARLEAIIAAGRQAS